MWPFGRNREASTPSVPLPVPAPVIRRDWATLPPIQRSIGEHPLTAPPDRFSDDLVTHHDPSVTSERMGHQVSAEAPPGMLLTVARSIGTRADGPAMIPRPRVQRRAQDVVAEQEEWHGSEAAPEIARPTPLPSSIQRTAVIERPVVEPIAEVPPLTSLPLDVEPQPVAAPPRRAPVPPHIDIPHVQRTEIMEVPSPPRLTLGQARRLGLGAPIKKVPERESVQRAWAEPDLPLAATPPTRTATETAAVPVAQPGNLSDLPRLPNAVPTPASPQPPIMVSRSITTESATRAVSDLQPRLDLPLVPGPIIHESSEQAPSAALEQPLSSSVGDAPSSIAPPAAVVGPVAAGGPPLQRSTTVTSISPTAAGGPSLQRSTTVASFSPTTTRSAGERSESSSSGLLDSVAPLVSARRISRTSSIQRATEPSAASSLASPASFEHAPQRLAKDASFSGMSAVDDAEASSEGGPSFSPMGAVVQRSAAAAIAAPPTGMAATAPALVLPPSMVRMPATNAASMTFPSRSGETGSDGDLPLAPMPVIVQRSASDESSSSSNGLTTWTAPWVQREPIDAPSAVESSAPPAAAPAGAAFVASSASPAATGSGTSEADMDLLAGRLYDKIRSRLKTELIVDRERAGFLTDLR